MLFECQNSTRDLCSVLFEFFGKHIVQPRCDIFEKATGLSVPQPAALGFLTQVESDAACDIARQHDLLGIHVKSVRSAKPAGQSRFGNRRNHHGGKPTGRGRGMSQLNRHLNSAQPSGKLSAQPPAQQSDQQQEQ